MKIYDLTDSGTAMIGGSTDEDGFFTSLDSYFTDDSGWLNEMAIDISFTSFDFCDNPIKQIELIRQISTETLIVI